MTDDLFAAFDSKNFDQDWRFEPLSFKEFVESPEHLNHPGLTERQYKAFYDLVGEDPKKVFANDRIKSDVFKNIKVILWGKGCVAGDTLIKCADTESQEIRNFKGGIVYSYTNNGLVKAEASEVIHEGKGHCLRITTRYGDITVYDKHLFLVKGRDNKISWKEADTLDIYHTKVAVLRRDIAHSGEIQDYSISKILFMSEDQLKSLNYDTSAHLLKKLKIKARTYVANDGAKGLIFRKPLGQTQKAVKILLNNLGVSVVNPFSNVFRIKNYRDIKFVKSFGLISIDEIDFRIDDYDSTDDFIFTLPIKIEDAGEQDIYTINVEETSNYISNGFVSHNSGKDMSSSMFQNWIFYLTLCMRNPTKFFGMPSIEEHIDIVNVAQNQYQSINVFFKRFTTRLKNWPWVRKHFRISEQGKVLNPELLDYEHSIEILSSLVKCTNSVHFQALHSASQSYEGLNVLMFTIDEGSAFPSYEVVDEEGKVTTRSTADDMLDVLSTSASSRNWNWIGILISYPRAKNCFQMRQYELGQKPDSNVLSEKAAPWEVLPSFKYSGKYVDWQGYRIPEEKLKEAEKNPPSFKLKFLCTTEETQSSFFLPEMVKKIFENDRKFALSTVDRIFTSPTGVKYLRKEIACCDIQKQHDFVFTGDYSVISDRTSMCVGHSEAIPEDSEIYKLIQELNKVSANSEDFEPIKPVYTIIDLLIVYQPNKKQHILVSHISIQETISYIFRTFNIKFASLDQMESAYSLERINMDGVYAVKHNVNDKDYLRLKDVVHTGLLVIPVFEPIEVEDENGNTVISYARADVADLLKSEFEGLHYSIKRTTGYGRLDHLASGSKDVLDTIASADRILRVENVSADQPSVLVTEPVIQSTSTQVIDDWSHLVDILPLIQ